MNLTRIYLFCAAGLMLLTTSCGKKEEKKETEKAGFELSAQMKQQLELSTASSEYVSSQLQLMGKVTPFEQKQVRVSPLVDGIIEKLSANLGDYVNKNQVLAIVNSSDVADVENQTVASTSDLLTAQKNLQVSQDLFKAGLASEKDVTLAQNELLKAKGSLKRSKDITGIYGIKNSFYTLKAPISGYIIAKNSSISEKMAYREGDLGSFFTIADLSTVQVVANIYESDISKVKVGYNVKIKLLAYPDKIITGQIDKLSNTLDPETRTMEAKINVPNPGNLLKPEMFAEIKVDFASNNQLVAIPSEAVIFDKNKNFVLVYKDPKHIEVREIQINKSSGSKAYLDSGLAAGETIISKNQLMIYNAISQ